jgi:hypothetical protein
MLWSLPRSISTAFEHSIQTLPGVRAFHEPFSAAFYLGEEMKSPRYHGVPPIPNRRYRDVVSLLETGDPSSTAYFAKDMAYAIADDYGLLPKGYTHSFLVRDPRKSIPSLFKILQSRKIKHWTSFLPEEFDYQALTELRDHLKSQGQHCPIIDADDLLANPAATMQAYCEAVALTFDRSMLTWDASSSHDRWAVWGVEWYETLTGSTGFIAPPPQVEPDLTVLPANVQDTIYTALPIYEALRAERLRVQ